MPCRGVHVDNTHEPSDPLVERRGHSGPISRQEGVRGTERRHSGVAELRGHGFDVFPQEGNNAGQLDEAVPHRDEIPVAHGGLGKWSQDVEAHSGQRFRP